MKLSNKDTDKLIDCLRGLPDPRKRRGIRHGKLSILAVSICAVLCGARSFAAISEWGKRCSQNMLKRLWCRFNDKTKRYEAPSEPTIRRLLQAIDAQAVDDGIGGWIDSLSSSHREAIAMDGKTLKGARRKDGKKVHLLSALVHQQGTPIAQREVAAKSNEIPSARPLLAPLDLEGIVVTADAMHTQKKFVNFLVEKKRADYCLTVKDNQPQLKEDIESLGLNKTFPPSAPNDE
jgi:hypothetical protein